MGSTPSRKLNRRAASLVLRAWPLGVLPSVAVGRPLEAGLPPYCLGFSAPQLLLPLMLALPPHRWCCSPRGWRTMPPPSATPSRRATRAPSTTACTAPPPWSARRTPASRWGGGRLGSGARTQEGGWSRGCPGLQCTACRHIGSQLWALGFAPAQQLPGAAPGAAAGTRPPACLPPPLPRPTPRPGCRTWLAWAATCTAACWLMTRRWPSSTSPTTACPCCRWGAQLAGPPGPLLCTSWRAGRAGWPRGAGGAGPTWGSVLLAALPIPS